MLSTNTLIILVVVLVIFYLWKQQENFSNCKMYKDNYDACYKAKDCTVMLDLGGQAFCTDR